MKKFIKTILILIPFMTLSAQYQEEFYERETAIGVSRTFIGQNQNPINSKVIDKDGTLRPYSEDPSHWGIVFLCEWNEIETWGINAGIRSQICDDLFYWIQRSLNTEDTDPESPWFFSMLEINLGANIYYFRRIRIASGLAVNSFALEGWDYDGFYLPQRGTYLNLGPYMNSDYLLSDDLLLKLALSVTFPVRKNVNKTNAKNPTFININPGLMLSYGLYFGVDYTIIYGLQNSAEVSNKTNLHASRLELKIAWFTSIF